MSTPRITFEQWSALAAVVDTGSYAKAAEKLHKSQSTLTYAINKIESLLGVEVFRIEGRRAVLTPNGEVLYRRGRSLIEEATELESVATQLAQGWEPEISVAMEIIFPTWLLLECMAEFGAAHPSIRIELVESVLGGTSEALTQRRADLAITPVVPPGFMGEALLPVRFLCMAAPSHPLHQLGRPVTRADLRRHRHLVIRDSGSDRTRDAAWLNELRWTVSNKATSIRAAVMGQGYAWYPEESVREEVQSGQLAPLPLAEGAERHGTLYLVLANGDAAGPGTRELADIIRARVRNACRAEVAKGAAPSWFGLEGEVQTTARGMDVEGGADATAARTDPAAAAVRTALGRAAATPPGAKRGASRPRRAKGATSPATASSKTRTRTGTRRSAR